MSFCTVSLAPLAAASPAWAGSRYGMKNVSSCVLSLAPGIGGRSISRHMSPTFTIVPTGIWSSLPSVSIMAMTFS